MEKTQKTKQVKPQKEKEVEKCSYSCNVKNAIIQRRNDNDFIIIVLNEKVLSHNSDTDEFTERETIAFSLDYIEKILSNNVIGYEKLLQAVEVENNENSTNSLISSLLINANIDIECIPYHIGDIYITKDGEQRQFENDGVQPRITALSVDMDTLLKVSQLVNILPK